MAALRRQAEDRRHKADKHEGADTEMGRMPKLVCLWPGLPQLWIRGAGSGLVLALGFTALVDVLLLASFVWTEWFRSGLLLVGWAVVGALWVAAACISMGWMGARERQATIDDGVELFREAQTQYLKGNWYEAETLLNQRLTRNVLDIDAHLLLATLKRHTSRWDEALEQLAALERCEHAYKWSQEIARERRLIARARAEQAYDAHHRLEASGDGPLVSEPEAPNLLTHTLHEAA